MPRVKATPTRRSSRVRPVSQVQRDLLRPMVGAAGATLYYESSSPSSPESPAEDFSDTQPALEGTFHSDNPLIDPLAEASETEGDPEARMPPPVATEIAAPRPTRWVDSPTSDGHILSLSRRLLYRSTLDMLPATPWYPGQREEMTTQYLAGDWSVEGKPHKTGRALGGRFQHRVRR
ncbi:hypothetical protein K503DRAFT_801331 [Rhizopogon vinicolor AM-OR11-026]|uniref:Uncharacterized protein n=1 Tax=Rhizopogon vinicolor AM-OR11-026 TaxID=1314800 RepID=A0A1B7MXI7_9AGAM|nr:hypothetical protein K503DRAFT_801331 [Rhizopogon vinicolor AM-OR11-026]